HDIVHRRIAGTAVTARQGMDTSAEMRDQLCFGRAISGGDARDERQPRIMTLIRLASVHRDSVSACPVVILTRTRGGNETLARRPCPPGATARSRILASSPVRSVPVPLQVP